MDVQSVQKNRIWICETSTESVEGPAAFSSLESQKFGRHLRDSISCPDLGLARKDYDCVARWLSGEVFLRLYVHHCRGNGWQYPHEMDPQPLKYLNWYLRDVH